MRAARLRREGRGLADDLGDALAADPAAAHVLHHVVVGLRAVASPTQAVEMIDESLSEVGTHLDDPDAGLGL